MNQGARLPAFYQGAISCQDARIPFTSLAQLRDFRQLLLGKGQPGFDLGIQFLLEAQGEWYEEESAGGRNPDPFISLAYPRTNRPWGIIDSLPVACGTAYQGILVLLS